MKRFALLLILCLPCAALATSAPSASPQPALKPLRSATPPNVTIINGKKFFSLGNARRFNGDANSPGALMVIHHPRSPETLIRHRSTLSAASAGGSSSASPESPASPAAPGASAAPGNDILSVFAPEEKGAAVPPAPAAPTK